MTSEVMALQAPEGQEFLLHSISFDWKIRKWSKVPREGLVCPLFTFFPDMVIRMYTWHVRDGPIFYIYRNHPHAWGSPDVKCKLGLVDPHGQERFTEADRWNFGKNWNTTRFTQWSWEDIDECVYKEEDMLIIRCTFAIMSGDNASTQTDPLLLIDNPTKLLKSLSSDLENLLEGKHGTDCVLKAGDTSFSAHRTLLSTRSPVFAAMFRHDTSESQSGEVNISDVEAEILGDLIHFIYTGKIRGLTNVSAVPMYVAADKYALLQLKQACLEFLLHNLTTENIIDVVILSHSYSEEALEKAVSEFMKRRLEEVLESDGWHNFLATEPAIANKFLSTASLESGGGIADTK